jgi:hypothetical protein
MEIITRTEAKAQGKKRFYTGKVCYQGHDCERHCSNGLCVECKRIVSTRYADKKRMEEDKHPLSFRVLSFINAYKNCKEQPSWEQALRAVEKRLEAEKLGRSTYDPEYPCTHGHMADRRVKESMCVKCQNESGLARMRKKRKNLEYKKKDNERALRYYHRNKALIAKKRREKWYSGEIKDRQYKYVRKNKSKYDALSVHYQLKKKQHCLSSISNKSFISLYEERDALTKKTGVAHEVDHFYPLQGKIVCGLHVPWNLHVIPASENRVKHNAMPEDFYGDQFYDKLSKCGNSLQEA